MDFHLDPVLLPEMDTEDSGFPRFSPDSRAPVTAYGQALLDLGRIHDLVIYNGLDRWPASSGFTCFPHGGRASIVDYILGSLALASQITNFRTAPLSPGADHTYLFFHILAPRAPPSHTPHYTTYHDIHFDHNFSLDYSAHLASLLIHIDTIPSLDH